jgi:outer membrane receptor protein involved in Fe transport
LGSLTLNYHLQDITLTSVTGYFHETQSDFDNFDATVFAQAVDYQATKDESFTQEVRAYSDYKGPINFTVGGFYQHETLDLFNTNKIAPLGPFGGFGPPGTVRAAPAPAQYLGEYNSDTVTANDRNDNYSAFGELNWKILDNLELSAGARFTHEHHYTDIGNVFNRFDYLFGANNPHNPLSPEGIFYQPVENSNNTSPEVTLTWHPEKNLTIYGAYKTGYLSGGAQNPGTLSNILAETGGSVSSAGVVTRNVAAENRALQYAPETVEGGEVGIKAELFGGRLAGDLTGFRYSYTNLQVTSFNAATTSFSITNAASSVNEGVEGQATFQLTHDLTLHGAFTYVSQKFGTFVGGQCYAGQTTAQGCVGGVQNQSNTYFGGPPFSWNLGATYEHPATANWKIAAGLDIIGNSNTPRNTENEPASGAPGYVLVNAAIRLYQSANHGPEFALIATNLTNTLYQLTPALDKPLGKGGDLNAYVGEPFELKLQVTDRF